MQLRCPLGYVGPPPTCSECTRSCSVKGNARVGITQACARGARMMIWTPGRVSVTSVTLLGVAVPSASMRQVRLRASRSEAGGAGAADRGAEGPASGTGPSNDSNVRKSIAKLLAVGIALGGLMVTHSTESLLLRSLMSAVGGAAFATYGFQRKSLSASGAVAAGLVGALTMVSSFRCTLVLLAFFFASSAITRVGEEKKDIDEEHKKGGQRDWKQVLCNGGPPTVIAILAFIASQGLDLPLGMSGAQPMATLMPAAYLGYYACCCGDTWASELGVLSKQTPRLITTFELVKPGTNGGITVLGTMASLGGGAFVGLSFAVAGLMAPSMGAASTYRPELAAQALLLFLLGSIAGLVGSVVDSVLGATIQYTGFNEETQKITSKKGPRVVHISGLSVLDNNAVNLVAASVTAITTSFLASVLFL